MPGYNTSCGKPPPTRRTRHTAVQEEGQWTRRRPPHLNQENITSGQMTGYSHGSADGLAQELESMVMSGERDDDDVIHDNNPIGCSRSSHTSTTNFTRRDVAISTIIQVKDPAKFSLTRTTLQVFDLGQGGHEDHCYSKISSWCDGTYSPGGHLYDAVAVADDLSHGVYMTKPPSQETDTSWDMVSAPDNNNNNNNNKMDLLSGAGAMFYDMPPFPNVS